MLFALCCVPGSLPPLAVLRLPQRIALHQLRPPPALQRDAARGRGLFFRRRRLVTSSLSDERVSFTIRRQSVRAARQRFIRPEFEVLGPSLDVVSPSRIRLAILRLHDFWDDRRRKYFRSGAMGDSGIDTERSSLFGEWPLALTRSRQSERGSERLPLDFGRTDREWSFSMGRLLRHGNVVVGFLSRVKFETGRNLQGPLARQNSKPVFKSICL